MIERLAEINRDIFRWIDAFKAISIGRADSLLDPYGYLAQAAQCLVDLYEEKATLTGPSHEEVKITDSAIFRKSDTLERPTETATAPALLTRLTAAVREADTAFETAGGSSRHYVRECLLPALEAAGLKLVDA